MHFRSAACMFAWQFVVPFNYIILHINSVELADKRRKEKWTENWIFFFVDILLLLGFSSSSFVLFCMFFNLSQIKFLFEMNIFLQIIYLLSIFVFVLFSFIPFKKTMINMSSIWFIYWPWYADVCRYFFVRHFSFDEFHSVTCAIVHVRVCVRFDAIFLFLFLLTNTPYENWVMMMVCEYEKGVKEGGMRAAAINFPV